MGKSQEKPEAMVLWENHDVVVTRKHDGVIVMAGVVQWMLVSSEGTHKEGEVVG